MTEVADGVDVTVQRDICMGIGDCRRLMPDVFLADEDNRSYVKEGLNGNVDVDALLDVAFTCPNSAISMHRDGHSLL